MKKQKRLTKRDRKGGNAYFPECFGAPCYGGGCLKTECQTVTEACIKLADYEDTYPATGWISVRSGIPEDQEEVLVCTLAKNGTRNIDKGYWSIDRFIHRGSSQVTHWMPLPRFPEDKQ